MSLLSTLASWKYQQMLLVIIFLTVCNSCRTNKSPQKARIPAITEELQVSKIWPGHPVGFSLLTSAPHQYVAYYDENRNMTVAHRRLGEKNWTYKILPSKVGWDSHNYIAMALDNDGHLHVSGNMHVNKLVYFYSTTPHDISTLQQVASMTGKEENRVTYPLFSKGPGGDMIYTYRDGSSGSGNQIYNTYNLQTKTWSRLLDMPLIDGEGEMNAYIKGPSAGPDGYYHMVWVWRDTPDASSNHDLSYARSKDLIHWEKSDGSSLKLPIRIATAEIVDPVPAKGGIINGNTVIGFDKEKRVVITYHKYDAAGNIQIYNARRESGGWKIYQATDWKHRWEFGGGGTITFDVHVQPVRVDATGKLTMGYSSTEAGSGVLVLDPVTMKQLQRLSPPVTMPANMSSPESAFPGMIVNFKEDEGRSPEKNTRYILRWETLGRNRDQPQKGALPEAGTLNLYKVKKN